MFNDYVFIRKEPFPHQKRFDCIPDGLIPNESFTSNLIKVRLFCEFIQNITCAFRSVIVQEVFF